MVFPLAVSVKLACCIGVTVTGPAEVLISSAATIEVNIIAVVSARSNAFFMYSKS
jgi:hypothetical protein